jgi:DNA-binding NarL/FixJ family response regulator
MLSVGLIDKYPIIATGLNIVLRDRFEDVIIHTQSNFENFHQLFKKEKLHVLVLGFYERTIELSHHIIQKCRKYFPDIPIIIFGEKVIPSQILMALKIGAKGYVSKQDDLNEITDCIESVTKGRRSFRPFLEEEIIMQFIANKTGPVKFRRLTEKQFKIAKYLSIGMGTSKIAETLNLKPSTVSTVKAIIFRKMSVQNVIELSNLVRNQ